MFKGFNRWYDNLNEPFRFLFFLVVLMGWLPLMYLESRIGNVIGAVWLCITCTIAISRI